MLVYRFSLLPQPCGQFQEYTETGWARCRPTGAAAARHRYAWFVRCAASSALSSGTQEPQLVPHFSFPPSAPTLAQPLAIASLIDRSPTPKQLQTIRLAGDGGARSAAKQRMSLDGIGRRRGKGGAYPCAIHRRLARIAPPAEHQPP